MQPFVSFNIVFYGRILLKSKDVYQWVNDSKIVASKQPVVKNLNMFIT